MTKLTDSKIVSLKKIAKKASSPNLASKQITDLQLATSFEAGDLLLLRKTGEGVDKAITQQSFIDSIGNSAVFGFRAVSDQENYIVLRASNAAKIDDYYNKMIITFISPITTTGVVKIGIEGLTYKDMYYIGTTVTSNLIAGKFYEAIYSVEDGRFYQTYTSIPYIYNNEYNAVGTVQAGNVSTKYALTSAVGAKKTGYYSGMSVLFTSNIASKGNVILNVDGLGERALQSQSGDVIPFTLLANQAVVGIYDGTVFRKHMFSYVEPNVADTIDVTITVGTGGNYTTIKDAINAVRQKFGADGGGRKVIIQLLSNFSTNALTFTHYTPWITIKTATDGNIFRDTIKIESTCSINFTGRFIIQFQDILSEDFYLFENSGTLNITNATIECNVATNARRRSCFHFTSDSINSDTTITNTNITGMSSFIIDESNSDSMHIFRATNVNLTLVNTTNKLDEYVLYSNNIKLFLQSVDFGNINRPHAVMSLIVVGRSLNAINVKLTCDSDRTILFINSDTNEVSSLMSDSGLAGSMSIRNSTNSIKPAVTARSQLLINGGNYSHPQSATSPDIVAENYINAVIRLRNFNNTSPYPQGRATAVGNGQIVLEV